MLSELEARSTLDHLTRQGCRYADLRETFTDRNLVRVRNGRVDTLSSNREHALGIRVLFGNGWGFAGTSSLDIGALARLADSALEMARAGHVAATDRVVLSERPPVRGEWHSKFQTDPFSVPLDRQIDHLLNATEPMRGDGRIHQALGEISSYRQRKLFASTDGAFLIQSTTEMGAGLEAHALAEGMHQRRTYPNPYGGDYRAAGWEHVESLDLKGHAPRVREEALALLDAPKAPAGRFDLLIGSSQLALQVHESCGHPAELDRALGYEISLAGGSFLQPPMLGHFRYGSDLVTITADATIPHAIGSFGWDDEGVRAERFPLVDRGKFVGYLTSRDTAMKIGGTSNGTVRGETAARLPLIRMTNINLEPGSVPLEELIAGTRRGIFVDTNKAWSIDDLRLNFQFGCEVAYEINDGKLGRLLRNPIYTGLTPQFWGSCDGVADGESWRVWGLPNCGKGEPMQTMRVAHGAPVARFRAVEML